MPVRASASPDGAQTLPQFFPPPERTVPQMLQHQAERHGQRRLVSIGGMTLTYAQASETAAGYAATLATAGIKPGDRVAIMCLSMSRRVARSSNIFSAIAARG
jgi:carnitine-CoA ligase